jgi:hypothetical protein
LALKELEGQKKGSSKKTTFTFTVPIGRSATQTLYIEGIKHSDSLKDVKINARIEAPAGITPDPDNRPFRACSLDATPLEITVYQVDLDVDSNNDNAFDSEGFDDAEDKIEASEKEDANGSKRPGKIVISSSQTNSDGDDVPDFADGFNLPFTGTVNELATVTEGLQFVPVQVELKEPFNPATAKVKFTYDPASKPELSADGIGVIGAGTTEDPYIFHLNKGGMRLWKKKSTERTSGLAVPNGDFIPVGTEINWTDIATESSTPRLAQLYLEYVETSPPQPGGRRSIAVTAREDYVECEDKVNATFVSFEVVTPDGSYTLDDNASATEVVTPFLVNSVPVPSLRWTSEPSASPNGSIISITIPAGIITDPWADLTSLDTTPAQSVVVAVDELEQTLSVSHQRPAAEIGNWKPFAYEGHFPQTQLTVPLVEGTRTITVKTSENVFGEHAEAQVAVSAAKRVVWGGVQGTMATVHFNLAFESSISELIIDSGRIFLGERNPTSSDPEIVETGFDSLEFTGPYEGGTVTVQLREGTELTANIDVIIAELHFEAADGSAWTGEFEFIETDAVSNQFRCALEMDGGGSGAVSTVWVCNAEIVNDQPARNFTPYTISVGALGDDASKYEVQIGNDENSVKSDLVNEGGKWFLKGNPNGAGFWKWGIFVLTEILNQDGSLKERHVWLHKDTGVWVKIVLAPNDPLPLKIEAKNGQLKTAAIKMPIAAMELTADSKHVAPYVTKVTEPPNAARVAVGELNLRNIAWIMPHSGPSGGPRMPALEAKLSATQLQQLTPPGAPSAAKIRWRMQVSYQRPQNAGGQRQFEEEDFVLVPCPVKPGETGTGVKAAYLRALRGEPDAKDAKNHAASFVSSNDPKRAEFWKELPPGQPWKLNEEPSLTGPDGEIPQRGLFGGKATIFCQAFVGGKWLPEGDGLKYGFFIGGRNPTDANCKTFIENNRNVNMTFHYMPPGSTTVQVSREFWFAYAIAKWETKGKAADLLTMREPMTWYEDESSGGNFIDDVYHQFLMGKFGQSHYVGSFPGSPVWGNDIEKPKTHTGGYGLFQLTAGNFKDGSTDPEIYIPKVHGGTYKARYLPADRVVEASGFAANFSSRKLFRECSGVAANLDIGLILNPMPRRWYWDWQENTLAQLQYKLPTKYREAESRLSGSRNAASILKNVMIPNSNPPTLEASPIPTHTLPRSAENTPVMIDSNGNGSTDDDTPLPMAAIGQIHPIKFAEEIDPANRARTRTMPGCADFLDLMLIRANNGGRYIKCDKPKIDDVVKSQQWNFNRVSTGYYTDGIVKRLDDNHGRGGQ